MSNSIEPKQNLTDTFAEGQFSEMLSKHWKNIIYGFIALIAILVVIYVFTTRDTAKAELDYIQAANDFALVTNPKKDVSAIAADEALQRLDALMKKHPELHAAYDGTLAQTLLERGQINQAKLFANATLARTKSEDMPLYANYAATTLLISEEQYQAALEKAQTLQKQMTEAIATQPSNQRTFGDELFAFNLLRIAMLQQQLGNSQAELQSWKEWKQYAGLETNKTPTIKIDSQAFSSIIQQLAIGTFTIPDYIAYREKVLEKSEGKSHK